MKTPLRFSLIALAGLVMVSSAHAGPSVVRCLVRDAQGKPRTAYVRVADKRIVYPQVVRQIHRGGGHMEYRPAISSAYRPGYYDGSMGYHPGKDCGYGYYGLPGRRFYPVGTGYPGYYRPMGNHGVDAILYNGNRGRYGIPGYGLPGGAFPRPVARPQSSVIQIPRYSGNVKGR